MNFINYYSWKGNQKVNGAVWRCELCKTFVRRMLHAYSLVKMFANRIGHHLSHVGCGIGAAVGD
ncbi:hypothetical protein MCC01971_11940 [Bifidobacteriaceae bacterium MCC01971]|nr:hypothetical protein MCC01971_11940 [Bifidobacteriaceae bacterium MCC01971]